jgi:hypothetical protein
MTQEHPVTPPPALIEGWVSDFFGAPLTPGEGSIDLATRAAQWGADQELEGCIDWMKRMGYWGDDGKAIPALRAARRPKPPSLKELALDDLRIAFDRGCLSGIQADTIRRALEQLPDNK